MYMTNQINKKKRNKEKHQKCVMTCKIYYILIIKSDKIYEQQYMVNDNND